MSDIFERGGKYFVQGSKGKTYEVPAPVEQVDWVTRQNTLEGNELIQEFGAPAVAAVLEQIMNAGDAK